MGSSHIPYFNFYPSDFMNGIRGMTAQEVGVYTMLLCRIYEENGPVECHELRLATYCGMRVPTFRKSLEKLVVLGKLYKAGDTISNLRAETEISNRATRLKNNSKAGKASAQKRQQNQSIEATQVQKPFNDTDTDTDRIKREAKASQKRSGGSRLSEDWVLSTDLEEWASSEGLCPDRIRSEAARFKDYWIALAGPRAQKADWKATWRNWIRKAIADNVPKFGTINGGKNDKPVTKSNQRMAAFLEGAQISS